MGSVSLHMSGTINKLLLPVGEGVFTGRPLEEKDASQPNKWDASMVGSKFKEDFFDSDYGQNEKRVIWYKTQKPGNLWTSNKSTLTVAVIILEPYSQFLFSLAAVDSLSFPPFFTHS